MKRAFFIAGLPRSRMAWLAAFLSYGKCACYHELFPKAGSTQAGADEMRRNPAEVVGSACASNVLLRLKLRIQFPEARWFVVMRPFSDVYQSCVRLGWPVQILERLEAELEALRGATWISFENMDTEAPLIYEQLTGEKMPQWRIDLFTGLNVQVKLPRTYLNRHADSLATIGKEILWA